jgi:hypothetical protein
MKGPPPSGRPLDARSCGDERPGRYHTMPSERALMTKLQSKPHPRTVTIPRTIHRGNASIPRQIATTVNRKLILLRVEPIPGKHASLHVPYRLRGSASYLFDLKTFRDLRRNGNCLERYTTNWHTIFLQKVFLIYLKEGTPDKCFRMEILKMEKDSG